MLVQGHLGWPRALQLQQRSQRDLLKRSIFHAKGCNLVGCSPCFLNEVDPSSLAWAGLSLSYQTPGTFVLAVGNVEFDAVPVVALYPARI